MYCMLICFAYMYQNSSYRYRYYMIVSICFYYVQTCKINRYIRVTVTSCDCPRPGLKATMASSSMMGLAGYTSVQPFWCIWMGSSKHPWKMLQSGYKICMDATIWIQNLYSPTMDVHHHSFWKISENLWKCWDNKTKETSRWHPMAEWDGRSSLEFLLWFSARH